MLLLLYYYKTRLYPLNILKTTTIPLPISLLVRIQGLHKISLDHSYGLWQWIIHLLSLLDPITHPPPPMACSMLPLLPDGQAASRLPSITHPPTQLRPLLWVASAEAKMHASKIFTNMRLPSLKTNDRKQHAPAELHLLLPTITTLRRHRSPAHQSRLLRVLGLLAKIKHVGFHMIELQNNTTPPLYQHNTRQLRVLQ